MGIGIGLCIIICLHFHIIPTMFSYISACHPYIFLPVSFSSFLTFLMLISVTVTPKPKKNIYYECNPTTPEVETALKV